MADNSVFPSFRMRNCQERKSVCDALRVDSAGRIFEGRTLQAGADSVEGEAMGIALNQTNDASFLRLDGVIDISVAADLKAALLESIAAQKAIRISAEAVSEFDVTAFQLLWAAGRRAKQLGMKFMLEGQMPSPVEGALSEMGFEARALFE